MTSLLCTLPLSYNTEGFQHKNGSRTNGSPTNMVHDKKAETDVGSMQRILHYVRIIT